MYKIYTVLLIIFLLTASTFAQECGPSCPVCSGAGSNDGVILPQRSLTVSALSIPTADEERSVLKTRYGLLSWVDVGVGYTFRTDKVLWSIRTQPVLEQRNSWRPGIILGTGSVQTGGSDQSFYAQLIKSLNISENVGLQLSSGVATLVPDFDEVYGLAGMTTSFFERYLAFASYDGKSFHEGISWVPSDWVTLSFFMVESEFPAISIVLKK